MKLKFELYLFVFTLFLTILYPSKSWAIDVLQNIQETGIVKIGIRKDAVLFGFERDGNWGGYCVSFANEFSKYLSKKMNRYIEARAVVSTIQTREAMVRNGTAYIECGPNTISRQKEVEYNIVYSEPFFISGTQLIISANNRNTNLSNQTIGVLQGTTNIRPITQVFPQAQIQVFSQRGQGVRAVRNGDISAFAGDTILLIGEAIVLQGWNSNDFELVPKQPLSCDAYGMILPANDPKWRQEVNSFLETPQGSQPWKLWFDKFVPYLKGMIDYCK